MNVASSIPKALLVAALLLATGLVSAAPVQVTPGSPATYTYFPRIQP